MQLTKKLKNTKFMIRQHIKLIFINIGISQQQSMWILTTSLSAVPTCSMSEKNHQYSWLIISRQKPWSLTDRSFSRIVIKLTSHKQHMEWTLLEKTHMSLGQETNLVKIKCCFYQLNPKAEFIGYMSFKFHNAGISMADWVLKGLIHLMHWLIITFPSTQLVPQSH